MAHMLKLDPDNWDMFIDEQGNWLFLDECQAVPQTIQTRLQTKRGEWFLDVSLGIPLELGLGGEPDLDIYEAEVKAAILSVNSVDRLTRFSLTRDNARRAVCSNFAGVTTCGDEFGIVT